MWSRIVLVDRTQGGMDRARHVARPHKEQREIREYKMPSDAILKIICVRR
jgi:hypothetical protein